jgi:alpha-ribazole phosphatase
LSDDVTRFWWIRHAPVPSLHDRIYGNLDPDCDTSDRAAFEGLAQRLPADPVWVVTSLKRTHQTSEAIAAAGFAVPPYEVEPDLGEQNFGVYHGVLHEENAKTRTDPFGSFWDIAPDHRPEGGESLLDVGERVRRVVERLADEHRGRDVVCVAHGGPIRAAVAIALDMPVEKSVSLSVPNLTLTRTERCHFAHPDGPRWRVRGVAHDPRLG